MFYLPPLALQGGCPMGAPNPFDIDLVRIRRGTRQQGGDWTFRAFLGPRRIGYLMIDAQTLEGHPRDERAPWKAAVTEEFRRRGVATKLYDVAETWLNEKGLKLVPGLGIPLHSVSDDAYRFWLNRAPDHPKVLKDARRFEGQYCGKPIELDGVLWTIEHTAGSKLFLIRHPAGDRTKALAAPLIWNVYGPPGEPTLVKRSASLATPDLHSHGCLESPDEMGRLSTPP